MNFLFQLTTHWQFWAFFSALAAAMTAIFAKLGVKDVSLDITTIARAIVIVTCPISLI